MYDLILIDSSNSLHNDKIGGTNSTFRRLLANTGSKKVLLLDASRKSTKDVYTNCDYRHVKDFKSIWQILSNLPRDSAIMDIYLKPSYRIFYLFFRLLNLNKHRFYKYYFSYPNSKLKRLLSFLDSLLLRYKHVFVVSPRQQNFLKTFKIQNISILLPAVTEEYYEARKNLDRKYDLCWVGRLDHGKGADLVLDAFNYAMTKHNARLHILAHATDKRNPIQIPSALLNHENCRIEIVDYDSYSPSLEKKVASVFGNSKYFLSPYRDMASTIDCPMLVQEAVVAGCIPITVKHEIIDQIFSSDPDLQITYDASDEQLKVEIYDKLDSVLENKGKIVQPEMALANYSVSVTTSHFWSIVDD